MQTVSFHYPNMTIIYMLVGEFIIVRDVNEQGTTITERVKANNIRSQELLWENISEALYNGFSVTAKIV